jgi:bleomycin hydrolase
MKYNFILNQHNMYRNLLTILILLAGIHVLAQNNTDKGKVEIYQKGIGYYYETILKDVNAVNDSLKKEDEQPYIRFVMDQSGMDLPDDPALYKSVWTQPPVSQGNAGTCWSFSTTAFYESEVYRLSGKKVRISEIYTVYWEYVEKARRYIEKRGDSNFEEGSEGNAVARIMKKYGAVPLEAYTGLIDGRKFHSHVKMAEEMKGFLKSLKENNAWNVDYGLETIKSIMNHYIGEPPASFMVDGKKYTPQTYLKDYLQINPDNYVEILSYMQEPYWEQVEYKVPDNWWHSKEYYNIPLEVYMMLVKRAIKEGYSMSIGGDISESGFDHQNNCALIPDYDIPSAYINEDARQFRFSNGTTTDDHGMQLIGILENYNDSGKDWYLIKDSSSGSRNVGEDDPRFGYYFFHEDYIKLKMMGFTIHKDAVKDILKKFK